MSTGTAFTLLEDAMAQIQHSNAILERLDMDGVALGSMAYGMHATTRYFFCF